jgi:hypothetical protein
MITKVPFIFFLQELYKDNKEVGMEGNWFTLDVVRKENVIELVSVAMYMK